MELFAGIDLGTSYFKAGLFDRSGRLLGLGRVAVALSGPAPRAELDVERFWALLADALGQAAEQADASLADVVAVGYSSQANAFCLLDEVGRPLTPLISWTDQRVGELFPPIAEVVASAGFSRATGVGIAVHGGLAVNKLLWLKRNEPALPAGLRFASICDCLAAGLTGKDLCDTSTLELTGLWDIAAGGWYKPMLDAIGFTPEQFGMPLSPGSRAGACIGPRAGQLGIPADAELVLGGLDHFLAGRGAGVGPVAELSVSLGTVLAALRMEAEPTVRPGCVTGPADGGEFYCLSFHPRGASLLEWFQRTAAPSLSIDELLAGAGQVAPGCDGLTLTPGEPGEELPGRFNRSMDAISPAAGARAVLECTAEMLDGLLDTLSGSQRPARLVATGGGAQSKLWLGIVAERLGMEVIQSDCTEPACRGAAALAARSLGAAFDPPRGEVIAGL
jgi:xylulokinase